MKPKHIILVIILICDFLSPNLNSRNLYPNSLHLMYYMFYHNNAHMVQEVEAHDYNEYITAPQSVLIK